MTTLLDLWLGQKEFFEKKSIEQLISIAGNGKLRDNNETSIQLRQLLANLPSRNIEKYAEECIGNSFQQSGLVLQDIVNEIGRRLGFSIKHGYYRGGGNRIGFDGVWKAKDDYSFVIEVKTTDSFQLNLDTLVQYRQRLINEDMIIEEHSSILLVVGRKDTGGLEAQTRGSRHAWDIRIISVGALQKLMRVKENLSDMATVTQIQEILKPLEYTRVDRLIDIIFTTSEDLQTEEFEEEPDSLVNGPGKLKGIQANPVKYHEECVERISKYLGAPLVKQGRCTYMNSDQTIRVLCIISKEYQRSGVVRFWYAFHPSQKEFLKYGDKSFVALGCGSAEAVILMPLHEFQKHLSLMRTTESKGRYYWHVEIFRKGDQFLMLKPTQEGIDVTEYLMKGRISQCTSK